MIEKILSGSPCLETLDLKDCSLVGRIPRSLFGNFGVLERLSCDLETYKGLFIYDDEMFLDNSTSMKLLHCLFNPPTGAFSCDKLKFLCIHQAEFDEDEDEIGYILSASPFLETLQLNDCHGVCRIDVASKSVKKLVLTGYSHPYAGDDRDTLEISAPYISSLTIEGAMDLEEILLQNVSSLMKADLNYWVRERYTEEVERDRYDVEEELLQGLLSTLGHVNEIALGNYTSCSWARSHLEATGFQFHKGSYLRGILPHG